MDMNQAFPSEFLRAADLSGREHELTMREVKMVELGSETKPCLYFEGAEKGLILNKTNCNTIVDGYGVDSDSWRGKTLLVYPTKTDFKGDRVDCIRVRVPLQMPADNGEPEVPF